MRHRKFKLSPNCCACGNILYSYDMREFLELCDRNKWDPFEMGADGVLCQRCATRLVAEKIEDDPIFRAKFEAAQRSHARRDELGIKLVPKLPKTFLVK